MIIYPEDFPDDLQSKISENIYKRGLPKIQQKMLHSTSRKTTLNAIKKLQQICNYKSFDKKSLENQEEILADLYTKYLLLLNSPHDSIATSMIGEKNNKVLIESLKELKDYWSSSNFSIYMCFIIKSINFTSGTTRQKEKKMSTIQKFIQDLYELNLIDNHPRMAMSLKNFLHTFQMVGFSLSNEEILKFLCVIINDMNLKSGESKLQSKKENVMFNFIVSLNSLNLINKKTINQIILDTVKNNRKKICKMLNDEFTIWLEY